MKNKLAVVLITLMLFNGCKYNSKSQVAVDSQFKGAEQGNVSKQSPLDEKLNEKLLTACDDSETTPEQISALIQSGADVNAKDRIGVSPLMHALSASNSKVISLLIKAGANVNAIGFSGWTPLIYAVIFNIPEVILELLQAGANINARDAKGNTPLILASMGGTSALSVLIDNGADINAQNSGGWTALMTAAAHNDPDVVALFLKLGADTSPTALNNDGELCNALAFASKNKRLAGTKVLQELKQATNPKTSD